MEVLFDIFSTTVNVQGILSPIRQYYLDMNTQFSKGFFSGIPKMDYTKLKKLVDQYDTMNSETTRKAELVPEITRSGTYNFYKYNSVVKIAKTLLGSLARYNDYGAKSNPNRFWVYLMKRVIDKYDTSWYNQITRLSGLSEQALFTELKGAFFSSPDAQKAFLKDYEKCIKDGCITMGKLVQNGSSRKTKRFIQKLHSKSSNKRDKNRYYRKTVNTI